MAEQVILTSSDWTTEEKTVGLTALQITKPSVMKNVRTVMITADKDNTGCISFGSASTITTTTGIGGQLQARDVAVIPVDLVRENQNLYVIADVASQKYYVSYFTGGDLC